ncbi:hypothetical protein N657DRAFT_650447 [Parathielavia appendiculata]|uniref:Uncharacterized protein n=1 Tax=Parathielavia appendiculata TaxID=2587402 RepID=A0AAN6TR44_9PEZI|nr:hypothetical protein N657DRAFT_650447 [Parathielavia appendiculata]
MRGDGNVDCSETNPVPLPGLPATENRASLSAPASSPSSPGHIPAVSPPPNSQVVQLASRRSIFQRNGVGQGYRRIKP